MKIKKMSLTLFTERDDKDSEESITVRIYHGKLVVGEHTFGCDELWPVQSGKTFTFDLLEEIPVDQAHHGKVTISKSKYGSPDGCGWEMKFELFGMLESGVKAELVPRTGRITLGYGNPESYEAVFQAIV